MVLYVMAWWYVIVRYGMALDGMVLYGMVWIWYSNEGMKWYVMCGIVWYGTAWYSVAFMAWYSMMLCGIVYDTVW